MFACLFNSLKVTALGAVMAAGVFFAAPAAAQSTEIRSTISQQIQAFQADDFATALGFASPNLQTLFGTPENFRRMVTNGFPMVEDPAEVRYLESAEIGGDIWQKVLIKDQMGVVHILGYRMLETAQGWKINGVQILKQPDVAA